MRGWMCKLDRPTVRVERALPNLVLRRWQPLVDEVVAEQQLRWFHIGVRALLLEPFREESLSGSQRSSGGVIGAPPPAGSRVDPFLEHHVVALVLLRDVAAQFGGLPGRLRFR